MHFSELSILLIEPSSTQRKIIVSHLEQAGVKHIDGVANANDALTLIKQYPPDLIISAMYLPDSTATELLNTVRSNQPDDPVNFMLVSSETRFSALDPIRQAGVVAILPKPFNHEDLQRALRTTVDYVNPSEIELENYDVSELKVLLVDDSLTARNHIKRVLTNLGMGRISTAENGRDAIDVLQQESFDLLITDLNMPEMDGQELVQYIREEMRETLLPILVVTSAGDDARLGSIENSGVSAICDKPFEPQSIREMLYRVLDEA